MGRAIEQGLPRGVGVGHAPHITQTYKKEERARLGYWHGMDEGWGTATKDEGTRNKVRHLGKHDGGLYRAGMGIPAQGELETELAPVEGAPNPAWPGS